MEEQRSCILVVIGANYQGKKELLAVRDGYRESEQSWKELLVELKSRGLEMDPKLAIADGALGFWKALPQIFPTTRAQRCWVHKTINVGQDARKRSSAGHRYDARHLHGRDQGAGSEGLPSVY
jgi:transposase-like protein